MLPANPRCPHGIGAAFYDLDGTILDVDKITPRVFTAMEMVHDMGCANVISTGRNLPIVPDIIKLPCIDYYITVNGGQILDAAGNHLVSKAIPKDKALEIARLLHDHGAGLNCLTSTGAYFENRLVSYMVKGVHDREADSTLDDEGLDEEITSQPNKYTVDDIEPEIEATDGKTNFVEKMGACFNTREDLARDMAILEARGDLQIAQVMPTEIEITLKGVEKGSGVEWIMNHLGLTKDQLVAFGDSGNDLPMAPYVGTFVAVANGSKEVKEQATCITESMWDDGVPIWLEAAARGEFHEI